jgi:hypothetical protein
MTKLAQEAAKLVDSLPPDKAQALLEYARFLAEKADEEGWDCKTSDPKYAAKINKLAQEVDKQIAAGKAEPLDTSRL